MEPVWVAAGAAVISSCAAIWSATNGNRTLKRSDRDAQARSRPIVLAELREDPISDRLLILVVRNSGQTIARDVNVTFTPPLLDPQPDKVASSLLVPLKRRYSKSISTLAPGAELDNIYFDGKDDGEGKFVNRDALPNQVTVGIAYEAQDGARYTDEYKLDVEVYFDRTYVTGGTHHPKTQRKKIVSSLENLASIEKSLETIAKNMPKNDPAPRPSQTEGR